MYWVDWLSGVGLLVVVISLVLPSERERRWTQGGVEPHYGDLEYKPSVVVVDHMELLMEAITELETLKTITLDEYVMTRYNEQWSSRPLWDEEAFFKEAQRRARNKVWNIAGLIVTDGRFETR